MKRAIALTLAVVFFLSVFLWLPQSSSARARADICYDDWEACRSRAFQSDEGIIKTTLWLTVCDLALGKCVLGFTKL
ncbi:MAG: hypothetical protein A2V45_00050 [Candidatus Aminicenantes bacterium RBG_19FT_COMBO_58_17]|jgi:hypothetical protein|nr:MAG: hypothetical protein A2V45_00050 [Candidatus Aminicenantes bacterium RBG_19FT_COMBO_58_17]